MKKSKPIIIEVSNPQPGNSKNTVALFMDNRKRTKKLKSVEGISISSLSSENNKEQPRLINAHLGGFTLLPESTVTVTFYIKKEFKKGDKVIRKSSYSGSNFGTVLKIKKESGGYKWQPVFPDRTDSCGSKVKLPPKISAYVKWDGKWAKTTWINTKSLKFYETKKTKK